MTFQTIWAELCLRSIGEKLTNHCESKIQICHLNSGNLPSWDFVWRWQFLRGNILYLRNEGYRGVSHWNMTENSNTKRFSTPELSRVCSRCARTGAHVHCWWSWTLVQPSGKTIHISQVTEVLLHFGSVISVLGKVPLETASLVLQAILSQRYVIQTPARALLLLEESSPVPPQPCGF